MEAKTTRSKFGGYKNAHERFIKAPGNSRARAIKHKCTECVNFEDVRERVGNCTVVTCALYSFRPFRKSLPVFQNETDSAA